MSKFVRNTSLYAIGNILPTAAGFFLLPVYSKYLSPAEYGIVNAMQTLSAILGVMFLLSIDRSIYRLYHDMHSEKERKDYFGTLTLAVGLISLISLGLIFLCQDYIGMIFKNIRFFPYIAIAVLASFFGVFSRIPKIMLQIQGKAPLFLRISVLQFVSMTVCILWYVVEMREGALGMLKGTLYGNLVMLPIFLILSLKSINLSFRTDIFKKSLEFSWPLIPIVIFAWVLNLSDRIFIERYFDLNEVGIYSMGDKIAGLVIYFSQAFNMAYNPVFFKLANSEDQAEARSKLYSYNSSYTVMLLLISFLTVLYAKEFIYFFLDARYRDCYRFIPLIAFANFIGQLTALSNLAFYQQKKTKSVMWFMLIRALVNIMFNFILIPAYGAYGAAFSTIISFSVNFGLMYHYSKKCYFIPFNWKLIGMAFMLAATAFMVFELLDFTQVYLQLLTKLCLTVAASVYCFYKYKEQILRMFPGKALPVR